MKQNGLISGVSTQSNQTKQSQDRLHSASGVRGIRNSQSKSKLMSQEERKVGKERNSSESPKLKAGVTPSSAQPQKKNSLYKSNNSVS